MADWSSFPPKLVRRIADCLLDTNDLDSYMGFRAVCPSWRSATDDPKDSSELRFRPCRWIVIDELFDFGSDSRLLVNTVSGRVVRMDLPLLRRYCFVATTHGGFFVLADKKPPHRALVLNPFTGHMIRFKAPVPCYRGAAAAALTGLFVRSLSSVDLRSSPTLILFWDSDCNRYMAAPDSHDFSRDLDEEEDEEDLSSFVLMQLAIAGGIYASDGWQRRAPRLPVALADKILSVIKLFDIDLYKMYFDKVFMGLPDLSWTGNANRFFLVESAGELLAIVNVQPHLKVFRLDTATVNNNEVEPVESLGGRAIFIGYRRCLSVNADKFPSVIANCIYYVKSTDSSHDIYQYDLKRGGEERVCEAIDHLTNIMQSFLKPITISFANRPFTILQFLSSYTINTRESQLELETFVQDLLPATSPDDGSYSDESDLDGADVNDFND